MAQTLKERGLPPIPQRATAPMRDVLRVLRLVDAAAYRYLAIRVRDGICRTSYPTSINNAMIWREQPHGHPYWSNLNCIVEDALSSRQVYDPDYKIGGL